MFDFLVGKFIKESEKADQIAYRLSLISLSSVVGIFINILLFAMKIGLGIFIKSQAVINDAFNNLSDSLVSLMALLGSNISKKPADKEHPFGHGRSEYVISLLVAVLIMYVGFSLFIKSVKSISSDEFSSLSLMSVGILLLSIAFKFYIYSLNKSLYKRLDSDLNLGVMLDARNDMLSTGAIIIAGFMQKYVSLNLDAIMGVILSFFVFQPGYEMFKETVAILLGQRVDKDIEENISQIIMEEDLIEGFHDLQIHEYGKGKMAGSVHVEVPANLTVEEVHGAIDQVEDEILSNTGVDLTIHMDPTYCLVEKSERSKNGN